MAGKQKKREKVPFGDVQWVMNNLSKSELSEMDESTVEWDDIGNWIQESVEKGWNFSVKWDGYSQSLQVSMVAGYKDMDNAGFALSSRSDDFYDALKIIYWKFEIVAEGKLNELPMHEKNVRG